MNATRFLESKTAKKRGWGRMPYRYVSGLIAEERQAVKDGHVVWFNFEPWHHAQSGYKVVTYWEGGPQFDSREPSAAELAEIKATQEVKPCK